MATINGIVTINDIWAVSLSGDPSSGGGTVAPIGTFGGAVDGTGFWSKTGVGDTAWNKALLNNLGIDGGTTFVGGTGVTDNSIYKGTSGNATTTLVAHSFVGGNNGATTIASLYNDGRFLIGTTTRNPALLGILRIGQGTSLVDIGQVSAGVGGIWLDVATPTATTASLYSVAGGTTALNASNTGGAVSMRVMGTQVAAFSLNAINFVPATSSSGSRVPFTLTKPIYTGQTASTELSGASFNLSASRTWATGDIPTQREFYIQAPTYNFVGVSTITNGATLAVSGAPISGGAFASITNSHAILVQATAVGAGVTNSYGLTVNAQTGATNNYVAQFLGGDIVIGDAVDFILNATTGTKIGTATTEKIGFWNATPIIQPASANQAQLTNSTGGTYNGTLVDVGVVFSQANINDNFTDVFTLLDAMRTAMVNAGLMKGAA